MSIIPCRDQELGLHAEGRFRGGPRPMQTTFLLHLWALRPIASRRRDRSVVQTTEDLRRPGCRPSWPAFTYRRNLMVCSHGGIAEAHPRCTRSIPVITVNCLVIQCRVTADTISIFLTASVSSCERVLNSRPQENAFPTALDISGRYEFFPCSCITEDPLLGSKLLM